MPSVDESVLRELHRAAVLAGRPGISVPSMDATRADLASGSRASTAQAVSRLTRDRRVERVRRDLLVLADSTGRTTATLPELVDVVAAPHYVITGGRALQQHDLTDQHFFKLVALAPEEISGFDYHGERAVFLVTPADRIWGAGPRRRGAQSPKPRFATPERAVLDAINHPRYGVSLAQAVAGVRTAIDRDSRFPERLANAARRYRSASTSRRAGLLVERIAGPAAAAPFLALIGSGRGPVALRAGGPRTGPVDRRWRVTLNVDVDLALEVA